MGTNETNETLFFKVQIISHLACAKRLEILPIFKKCHFFTHIPKMGYASHSDCRLCGPVESGRVRRDGDFAFEVAAEGLGCPAKARAGLIVCHLGAVASNSARALAPSPPGTQHG